MNLFQDIPSLLIIFFFYYYFLCFYRNYQGCLLILFLLFFFIFMDFLNNPLKFLFCFRKRVIWLILISFGLWNDMFSKNPNEIYYFFFFLLLKRFISEHPKIPKLLTKKFSKITGFSILSSSLFTKSRVQVCSRTVFTIKTLKPRSSITRFVWFFFFLFFLK